MFHELPVELGPGSDLDRSIPPTERARCSERVVLGSEPLDMPCRPDISASLSGG